MRANVLNIIFVRRRSRVMSASAHDGEERLRG
jgi:hypothetical protein